jgi:hypothetical protein
MEGQNNQIEVKDKDKKKIMVSLLMPTPILDSVDDIGVFEERSRSATLVRLVKMGLKSYDYQRVV